MIQLILNLKVINTTAQTDIIASEKPLNMVLCIASQWELNGKITSLENTFSVCYLLKLNKVS